MSDFEENDDFMCDDEEDYGLVSTNNKEVKKKKLKKKQWHNGLSMGSVILMIFLSHTCIFSYNFNHFQCFNSFCVYLRVRRNIRKIAIQSQMLIWRINIITVKHWKRMNRKRHCNHFKRFLISKMVKKVNGVLKHWSKWLKSISSYKITMKWWYGTSNCSHTLKVRLHETIRKNPSIQFWITFQHRKM